MGLIVTILPVVTKDLPIHCGDECSVSGCQRSTDLRVMFGAINRYYYYSSNCTTRHIRGRVSYCIVSKVHINTVITVKYPNVVTVELPSVQTTTFGVKKSLLF